MSRLGFNIFSRISRSAKHCVSVFHLEHVTTCNYVTEIRVTCISLDERVFSEFLKSYRFE